MTDDIRARLAAALGDRYAIDRLAGEGGMATVFLAQDLKHRRAVAIKVLRPELGASIGPDRFLREVELAARMQHPHIVPVYDSGRVPASADGEGLLYYIMPFVEGESLRARLQRERQLPIDESVRLVREVAGALGYAHGQGIVHRDVKPENILLSGGHAMVADFGIARAVDAAAVGATARGTALTGLGISVGTPAYMSPEQATASDDVDGRSDQYGLACVLYEMLAGQPAFAGSSVQSILTKTIAGPRPRVRAARKAVPAALERVLTKALATDPADRYPSMAEFSDALGAAGAQAAGSPAARRRAVAAIAVLLFVAVAAGWLLARRTGGGAVVEGAERIAVLPFSTSGPGVELMGEGMVDLLSTNLDAVGGISTVEPRTVLARWHKRGGKGVVDLDGALAVGKDVDAGAVLLGSVVATGRRVRLNADLYGRDGVKLARAQVDGPADSVLALVDGLSVALMREIWRSKDPMPSLRVSGLTTTSVDAMRSYLRGEQFYRRSVWDSAQAAFGQAAEQDSTFALAQYRLAMTHGWTGNANSPPARAAGMAAVRFAGRLPERDRTLVVAYRLFQEGQVAATDTMRRYVAQYPTDADGWYLLGESQFHTRSARPLPPAALREPFDRVLTLDPSLTPAAIHPIELAVSERDTALYAHYLGILEAAGAADEAAIFSTAEAVVRGGPDADSAMARLFHTPQQGATFAALLAVVHAPDVRPDSILHLLQAMERVAPPSARPFVAGNRAVMLAALGRLRAMAPLVDSVMKQSQDMAYGAALVPVFAGFAPAGYGRQWLGTFDRIEAPNPYVLFIRAARALAARDPRTAHPLIQQGLAFDTTKYSPRLEGLFVGARGWAKLQEGDTTGGIADLRAGIDRMGGMGDGNGLTPPLRLQLALALVARPETRDEGIRRLEYGFPNDLGYVAVTRLALGRAYEAAGRRQDAAAAYGDFARLWSGADPELQPLVTEARTRLAALTAERR